MPKFDLRSKPEIAGEQPEQGRRFQAFEAQEELAHTKAYFSLGLVHDVVEPKNIALSKAPEILGGRVYVMKAEELAHEAEIGASREFEAFETIDRVELAGKDFGESFDTCTACADKGTVDVEENQAKHCRQRVGFAGRCGNQDRSRAGSEFRLAPSEIQASPHHYKSLYISML